MPPPEHEHHDDPDWWHAFAEQRMAQLRETVRSSRSASGAPFLYRPGQLVVASESFDELRELLQQWNIKSPRDPETRNGVTRVFLADTDGLGLLADLAGSRPRLRVAPNYVYRPSIHRMWGLPTPPVPAAEPAPPSGDAGSGIAIGIIDTGYWPEHPWFNGAPITGDTESPFEDYPESGHGTFVAGIIRQYAPGASITMLRTDLTHDYVDDWDVPPLIEKLAAEHDIVNLSLGTTTIDGTVPIGLDVALRSIAENGKRESPVLIVAAAGNEEHGDPEFPAADKRVIGVGAVDGKGNPAPWTNTGGWVDAAALGVDVTSAYFKGTHPQAHQDFELFASWSGTSFAAPLVAARLAVAMWEGRNNGTGGSSLDALHTVIRRPGPTQISGLGTLVD